MFFPVSNTYIIPFVSHSKFSTNFFIVIREDGTSIWLYFIANIIFFLSKNYSLIKGTNPFQTPVVLGT